jgi:hypothetical protein
MTSRTLSLNPIRPLQSGNVLDDGVCNYWARQLVSALRRRLLGPACDSKGAYNVNFASQPISLPTGFLRTRRSSGG